jgi:integrase
MHTARSLPTCAFRRARGREARLYCFSSSWGVLGRPRGACLRTLPRSSWSTCLPARSSLPSRPLTDDEVALCRSFSVSSLTETRRPAAWALAETSARTSEVPDIRVRDVDIDEGRVWLWGSTKAEPRWGELTEWGCKQLARQVERVNSKGPDALLIYEGARDDKVAQISSCIAIGDILRLAGLAKEPDVRPHSVVAWAGSKASVRLAASKRWPRP